MERAGQPLVSFVMPVYNSEKTIVRAVRGILGQTYQNMEIILVDDGSTDGTLAILRDLEMTDERIKVVAKQNGGPASARNAGLDIARGEWIHFHDSDDWMAPTAVERMVDATGWGTCDMVVTNFYRVCRGRVHSKGRGTDALLDIKAYMRQMSTRPSDFFFCCSWNKLLRRDIIEEYHLRQNEAVRYGEDHLLLLQYLSHVRAVAVVGEPLYYYLDRPGSLLHQGLTPFGFAMNRKTLMAPYAQLCAQTHVSDGVLGKLRFACFFVAPATDGTLLPWDPKLGPEDLPR